MAKKIEILENTLLKLLVRRGTDTDRRNISLSEGELGYTTDTERLFIGNGQPGGVVAGNRYLGSDSDPAATFTTALTGDLVFDTNTKSLCAFKGSGVWERVSSLTESTGDIDVLVDAGDILTNACGRNMQINTNGRIQTKATSKFNRVETINTDFLSIPRKLNLFDGTSNQSFTFPTNALGGKYLRTDASGVLTWEDPVGAAEFFYNSENGPIPVGAVLPFTAGGVIPTGYIICNGQEVSQTTYSDLFDVIGTNYGTTNPGSTFKVPDYSLSTLYGVDSDPHNAQVYKVGADVNLGGGLEITSGVSRGDGPGGTFTVAPPAGYTMSDLQAFIPSIHEMYYNGTVDLNDTTSCKYVYGANEITVTVKNSEQRAAAFANWLAVWETNGAGSGGTTITQEGFGSYSSGWVNSGDNSVAVAGSATLSFNHNLNSDNVVVQVYAATNAAGDNATLISGGVEAHSGNGWYNSVVTDVTNTTLDVFLAANGWRDTQQTGASYAWSPGTYIKVVALAADAVVSTPSTQSPLSAQGTIYVIKAIPDTVANPTLTVVSPLTATVDGVNKTNTAFSPLVGDIEIGIGQTNTITLDDVQMFNFRSKVGVSKGYMESNDILAIYRGSLPISFDPSVKFVELKYTSSLANPNAGTFGAGFAEDSTNGTVYIDWENKKLKQSSLRKEGDANHYQHWYESAGEESDGIIMFNTPDTTPANSAEGIIINWSTRTITGLPAYNRTYSGGGADNPATLPPYEHQYIFRDLTNSGSFGSAGTGGGSSSLLKYGEINAGNIGVVTSNPPTVGDFTTTVVSNSIAGDTHDTTFECTFNTSLANDNYNVMFEIISNGTDINKDNNLKTPVVFNKTASGFRFNVEEGAVSNIGDNQINVRIESNEVGLGSIGGLKDPNHTTVDTFDVTTSFQDLDLSSIVGSNKAQVTMEVYDGDTGCNLFFRRKGSVTDPYNAGNNAGWGASSVTTGPSNDGGIVTVVTDSSGVTEYRSDGTSNGVIYKVLTYQVIS